MRKRMMGKLRKNSTKYYLRQIVACLLVYCILLAVPMQVALAKVVMTSNPAGTITVSPLITTTQAMTATNGAIGYFNDFDIATGHAVTCDQFGVNNNALFKIFGDGTQILGNFTSNGNIYLIDPAGILFGPSSQVNVNKLVASGLNMDNQDFLDFTDGTITKMKFEGGSGTVTNAGIINATDSAYLVGTQVLNTSSITSPIVVLAAGEKVFLNHLGSNVFIEVADLGTAVPVNNTVNNNSGTINATEQVFLAAGDIFSTAISGVDSLAAVANKDITLGNIQAGEITLTADYDDVDGGDVIANGTLTSTTGNIEISASDTTIHINEDVTAEVDLLLNNDTEVAADKTLEAGNDVVLAGGKTLTGNGTLTVEADEDIILGAGINPGNVTADGTLTLDAGHLIEVADGGSITADEDVLILGQLKALGDLTIEATTGGIDVEAVDMAVDDSLLSLTQNNSLHMENALQHVSNSEDTDLSATSTGGSVTSSKADTWQTIEAWAQTFINLNDGSTGGDITTLDLYAEEGDIKITANDGKVFALGDIDAGRDVVITATDEGYDGSDDAIFLGRKGEVSGPIEVAADRDILLNNNTLAADGVWIHAGQDVKVGYDEIHPLVYNPKTLTGEGDLTVEADQHIKLGGAVAASSLSSGDLVLKADADTVANPISGDGIGDMIAYGTITNPSGDIDIYSSDSTTELWDNVILSGDLTLHNNTVMKAAGKILQSTGDDVILAGGKTLDSDFDLTILAADDIILGITNTADTEGSQTTGSAGDVAANGGDLILNAGDDIYAHGSLTSSGGSDVDITAVHDIRLYGPVTAEDNIYITAVSGDGFGTLVAYANASLTANTGEIDILTDWYINLWGPVSAYTDLTLNADDTSTLWNDGYIYADKTLTADTGNIVGTADDRITFMDVATAGGNITLDADSDNMLKTYTPYYDDLEVHGLVAGGYIDLSAGDSTINIYKSADSLAPADVDAGGDIILRNNTETEADVVLDAGDDVILAGGKTLNGLGALTVQATDDIILGVTTIATHEDTGDVGTAGNVSAAGDMTLNAGDDIYAHGTLTTTSGGDIDLISADDTTYLWNNVTAEGDIILHNDTEVKASGKKLDAGDDVVLAATKTLDSDYDLTIEADDDIILGVTDADKHWEFPMAGFTGNVSANGDLTLKAVDDVYAHGTLTTTNGGDIDIYSSDNTTFLWSNVTAAGDIILHNSTKLIGDRILHADDDVVLAATKSLSYYGAGGTITLEAGDDIILGVTNADSHWVAPDDGSAGNVTSNEDLILIAGDDIYAHGWLQTFNGGNITATAVDNINLYKTPTSADADGTLTLTADSDDGLGGDDGDLTVDGALYGNMALSGYDVTVNGDITSYGPLDIDADYQVDLYGAVEAQDDITITVEGGDEAYVYTHDTVKSLAGNIDISAISNSSSYAEIDLGGDVEAYGDLSLFADTTYYDAYIYTEGLKTITGDIDVFSDYDMEFYGPVEAYGNMILTAGNDGDDYDAYGDVYAYDTLKSVTGDITINGSYIVELHDAVEAYGNVSIINRQPYYVDCYVESYGSDATITALTGDVSITTDYYMDLEGDITAQGNITLIADGPVGNPVYYDYDGYIDIDAALTTTAGDISASAEYDVTVYGNVQSGGTLDVDAGDDIELSADVSSVGVMTMDAGDDIKLNEDSGDTTSDSTMTLIAGKTNNWGDVEAWGTLITTDDENGDLFVSAADNIRLHAATSADAAGELQLLADTDNDPDGGDVVVDGALYGNMTLSGVNVTVDGEVDSAGILDVDADDDIRLKSNVHSDGVMTMDAGSDIDLNEDSGNTSSDSTIALTAGDDITIGRPMSGEGNVTANGHMNITAGTDSDDDVKVYGKLTTTNGGNIDVEAGDDISIYGTFDGLVFESAQADGDLTLDAEDDVDVLGDLISNSGNIEIYSSDLPLPGGSLTTYLGGDKVQAFGNILLNNNTVFDGDDDQKVDAQTGIITANGWLYKGSDWGSLYLEAAGDISLADDVEVSNGGVSIISETGTIFTPDEFGEPTDTLNVPITGYSNDEGETGAGVILPYGPGKAAIVVMSEADLKLGEGAVLTAFGMYDNAVDDRAGVGFLDDGDPATATIGGILRDEGDPFDVAIYLASTDGDVDVSGPVSITSMILGPSIIPNGNGNGNGEPIFEYVPPQGAMVIDAWDTVTFDGGVPGGLFETSLADGYVGDRLEVVSRITEWLFEASIYGTLPYPYGGGPFPLDYTYVLRGAGLGNGITDGRAWVLEDPLDAAPLYEEAGQAIEPLTLGLEGCPVLLVAVSAELGVPGDTIEVSLANSFALNTDIQPCESCARLLNAATILRDEDGSRMAAMTQMFNDMAPGDSPYTPEMQALIVTAFAGAAEGSQYATVMQYTDAFVQYLAVLSTEMGSPVADGDSLAFIMGKYGAGVLGSDNSNIAAFVAARLESGETFGK